MSKFDTRVKKNIETIFLICHISLRLRQLEENWSLAAVARELHASLI
jgi:hypothetical protein